MQQQQREVAEELAREAAQSGDKYDELLAESGRHASQQDWRRSARTLREAIALKPDEPTAYHNLGATLTNSGHNVEAAQRFLEAKERYSVGSELWAQATAEAFDLLARQECAEVAKPEWWNDEGLKALSARVLRTAPNEESAIDMRAHVLRGAFGCHWEVGPRSAAELKEAAVHYDRCAAMSNAPTMKAELSGLADWCRSRAEAKAFGGRAAAAFRQAMLPTTSDVSATYMY